MKNIKNGFTLIEMILTVTLVIILSTISASIYNVRVTDAKNAEGYLLLKNIRDAQAKYYAEYNTFYGQKSYTGYDPVLGVKSNTNKYFTCFAILWPSNSKFEAYVSGSGGTLSYIYSAT